MRLYTPDSSSIINPGYSAATVFTAEKVDAVVMASSMAAPPSCGLSAVLITPRAPVDMHDAYCRKYKNGAIGTVFGASNPFGTSKHQLEVRIFGDEGQMIIDLERELVWLYR